MLFLIFDFTFLFPQLEEELGNTEDVTGMYQDIEYILLHSPREGKIKISVFNIMDSSRWDKQGPYTISFRFLTDSTLKMRYFGRNSYLLIRNKKFYSYDIYKKKIRLDNGGAVKDSFDYKIWHYKWVNRKVTSHSLVREKYDSTGRIIDSQFSWESPEKHTVFEYEQDSLILTEHRLGYGDSSHILSSYTPFLEKREGDCITFTRLILEYSLNKKEPASTTIWMKRCLNIDKRGRIVILEKYDNVPSAVLGLYRGKMLVKYTH